MGRFSHHLIALAAAALLLGAGCSSGDKANDAQGSVSTAVGEPTTTAGSAGPSDTTSDTTASSVEPGIVTDPSPTSEPPANVPGTTVPAAGEWRLVVNQPSAGVTVGRMTVLCYEVTGPGPGPDIALEVTVAGRGPVEVEGMFGRGLSPVDLGAPATEPLDVRIRLIVNGQPLGAVTVPAVLIVPAAAPPNCP